VAMSKGRAVQRCWAVTCASSRSANDALRMPCQSAASSGP
jgi:hypothetical protein